MLSNAIDTARELFTKGGWAMWPLLALSLASASLAVERALYWMGAHRPGRSRWLVNVADRLRKGDSAGARAICASDGSLYGRFVVSLLDRGCSDDAAVELVELHRPRFERSLTALSTIFTAAPLLGILGTVSGIITSFELLGAGGVGGGAGGGGGMRVADPSLVASGIAEALITTAAGLIIAVFTLFALVAYRTSASRCLSRLEALSAAAAQGQSRTPKASAPKTSEMFRSEPVGTTPTAQAERAAV